MRQKQQFRVGREKGQPLDIGQLSDCCRSSPHTRRKRIVAFPSSSSALGEIR